MSPALRLLDDVSWRGSPLPGDRPAALLAALALSRRGLGQRADRRGLGRRPPGQPVQGAPGARLAGALAVRGRRGRAARQRLPARGRARRGRRAADRAAARARGAPGSRRGIPGAAATLAGEALDLAAADDDELAEGPLAEIRARARRTAHDARRLLGLSLARSGREREALEPLRAVSQNGYEDTEILEALLRAEALVSGVPVALEHYEAYRSRLRDRLGVDPADSLQRLHRELLAADDPVRTGVRYDAEELLGREDGPRAAARRCPHGPADLDHRARRDRQDPDRPRAGPGGDPGAGALRRAGRHHLAGRRRRGGRCGSRGARLGHVASYAHPRAAR